MTDRQHIESYMRTRTRTLIKTDWWRAGTAAGTAPSEWETVQYGRDTALGWLATGSISMEEAISKGFRALYLYAYSDIRGSITRTGGRRTPVAATSDTDVYTCALPVSQTLTFDTFDWIARAPLSVEQRRIVVLFSLGWRLSEVSEDLGLSDTSVRRWFKAALPILGEKI